MKMFSVRTLITATAATAVMSYSVSPAAQTPAPQPQQPQPPSSQQPAPQPPRTPAPVPPSVSQTSPSSPIEGELLEVDSVKMTLTIVNEKRSKDTFIYTNTTLVTNAAQSPTPVAGLATMKNSRVIVHFEEKAGVKTATRIEVKPATAASPSQPVPNPSAPR